MLGHICSLLGRLKPTRRVTVTLRCFSNKVEANCGLAELPLPREVSLQRPACPPPAPSLVMHVPLVVSTADAPCTLVGQDAHLMQPTGMPSGASPSMYTPGTVI